MKKTFKKILLIAMIILLFLGICAMIELLAKCLHPLFIGAITTIIIVIIGLKGV